MNGLSIAAVLLAVATTLLTWVDFSSTQADESVQVHALLNAGARDEIKPEEVKSLRVAQWDAEAKEAKVFAVAYQDGAWLIPSHHNYPADGGSRVGETAGSVLNVPRGPLVTQDVIRHAELGVLDPLEDNDAEEGYGERVTVEGEGGNVLLDLIVGKRSETANVVYVREAGQDQVFTADISLNISTAFKDWVETDVLKLELAAVRDVLIQDYSVNEQTGQVEQRAETDFKRINTAEPWESKVLPKGKQISKEKVDGIVQEATSLKLAGVRPYNDVWLQSRGFYIGQNGQIFGNEGALMLGKENGVMYFLFFGEIALGDESAQQAEIAEDQKAKQGDNRYMVVFTRYDERSDRFLADLRADKAAAEKAKTEAAEEKAKQDAPAPADKNAEVADSVAPEKDEAAAPERDFDKEIAARIAEGQKEAADKQERFGKFFYVIADSSFKKLRPAKDLLFVDPPKPAEDEKK